MTKRGGGSLTAEELERALCLSGTGVWAWDAVTEEVRWSPEMEQMFDIPVGGGFPGTREGYQQLVHPADWPQVERTINELFNSRSFDPRNAEGRRVGTVGDSALSGPDDIVTC